MVAKGAMLTASRTYFFRISRIQPDGCFVERACKNPRFSRNLIVIIFVPAGIVVTLAFNKGQGFFPSLIRDPTAGGSAYEVCKLEMDSAIPTGYSGLVCSIRESGPGKGDFLFGRQTWLGVGASCGERNGIPEFVTVGKALKNLGTGRAESAMARDVFRERWGRKRGLLVGNPQ